MRRRALPVAVALSAAVLAAPDGAGAQVPPAEAAAAALMETASARHRNAAAMCTDFTERRSVPLLGQECSGRGRVCQQRPNKFGLRYLEPAGDLVVGDGTWIWVYTPSQDPGQVLRIPASRAPGGFDFYREFFQGWREKYRATAEGAETVAGRPTRKLRLVPTAAASFESAVLWLEADGVLRQLRIEEENASVRTFTFTSAEMDTAPATTWFVFTPPRGVQVIGG